MLSKTEISRVQILGHPLFSGFTLVLALLLGGIL